MKRTDITTKGWSEYELIDSGQGRKLERFNTLLLDRPDPQALWSKQQPAVWTDAHAQFLWGDTDEKWRLAQDTPDTWSISHGGMNLSLSFKGFKHIGVFPEHDHQWELLREVGTTGLRMLNLFGYTGAASIAGVQSGMEVTHVDASKSTIDIVKENIKLSNLPEDSVRLICEDALKYAKRLVQRGEQFEVIIMDPPAFGRGPKGELWKIEESLHELVALLPHLLSKDAKLVVLNGYASGYGARTFAELLQEVVPTGEIAYGDIGIQEQQSERTLSTGIYAMWRP